MLQSIMLLIHVAIIHTHLRIFWDHSLTGSELSPNIWKLLWAALLPGQLYNFGWRNNFDQRSGIFRLDCGLYQFTDNVIIIGFFCHVLGMVTTVHSPSPRRVRDPRILNIGITCLWDKLECVYFWFKVPLFRMQSVRVAIKLPTRNIIYIAPLYIITPPLQQLQHNTATNCSGEINWQNVNSSVLQFGH